MKLVQQTESKECRKCGETKPLSDYYKHKRNTGGLHHSCKACMNKTTADSKIFRRYGIKREEWNRLYADQEGCCACCGTHQIELKKRLAVDHCHETGKIRGLLCTNCNAGIGQLGDNIEGLMKAIKYLEDAE